jgi:branched-chain amino acid aminotransferase
MPEINPKFAANLGESTMENEVVDSIGIGNTPILNNLERLAAATKLFVSMPYIRGITPRSLVENGLSEPASPATGTYRIHGIFQPEDIGIPLLDHGLLYGDGVFEGVLVTQEQLFQWRPHLERLYTSASRLQIAIPYTREELTQFILQTVQQTIKRESETAYLRLVVTRGPGDLGINPAKCVECTIYCIASQIQLYESPFYAKGISLGLAGTRRPGADILDPSIKSCNYLNNILGLLDSSGSHYQESLMLTQEGFVAQATTENVFVILRKAGWETDPLRVKVLTPGNRCLQGITRKLVLGYARALHYQVDADAKLLPLDLLDSEREVFLTGTAAGIVPVTMFAGRTVGNGKPGPITCIFRDRLAHDMEGPENGLSIHAGHEEISRYLCVSDPDPRGAEGVSPDFIRFMFRTIDGRNWDRLENVFCQDVVYERPGYEPLIGYDRVLQFYRTERVIASGEHLLEGITISENGGACWGRFIGRHKNGSSIDERFADAYTFQLGKIKTRKSYFFRPAV